MCVNKINSAFEMYMINVKFTGILSERVREIVKELGFEPADF